MAQMSEVKAKTMFPTILQSTKTGEFAQTLASFATEVLVVKGNKFFIDFYSSGNVCIKVGDGYSLSDSDIQFVRESILFANLHNVEKCPRVRFCKNESNHYLLRVSSSLYYYNHVVKFFQHIGSIKEHGTYKRTRQQRSRKSIRTA